MKMAWLKFVCGSGSSLVLASAVPVVSRCPWYVFLIPSSIYFQCSLGHTNLLPRRSLHMQSNRVLTFDMQLGTAVGWNNRVCFNYSACDCNIVQNVYLKMEITLGVIVAKSVIVEQNSS